MKNFCLDISAFRGPYGLVLGSGLGSKTFLGFICIAYILHAPLVSTLNSDPILGWFLAFWYD